MSFSDEFHSSDCLKDYFNVSNKDKVIYISKKLKKVPLVKIKDLKEKILSNKNINIVKFLKGGEILNFLNDPLFTVTQYYLYKTQSRLYGSASLNDEFKFFLKKVKEEKVVIYIKDSFFHKDFLVDPWIDHIISGCLLTKKDIEDSLNHLYQINNMDLQKTSLQKLNYCFCENCDLYKKVDISSILNEFHINSNSDSLGFSTLDNVCFGQTYYKGLSFFENATYNRKCFCDNCVLCKLPKLSILIKLLNDFNITEEDLNEMISGNFWLSKINKKTSLRNVSKFILCYNEIAKTYKFPKIKRSVHKDVSIINFVKKYTSSFKETLGLKIEDFDLEEEINILKNQNEYDLNILLIDFESGISELNNKINIFNEKKGENFEIQRQYECHDLAEKTIECITEQLDSHKILDLDNDSERKRETNERKRIRIEKSRSQLDIFKQQVESDDLRKELFSESKVEPVNHLRVSSFPITITPKCKKRNNEVKCLFSTQYIDKYNEMKENFKDVFTVQMDKETHEKIAISILLDEKNTNYLKKDFSKVLDKIDDRIETIKEKIPEALTIFNKSKIKNISSVRVIEKFRTDLYNEIIKAAPRKVKSKIVISRSDFSLKYIGDPRQREKFEENQGFLEFYENYRNILGELRYNYKDRIKRILENENISSISMPNKEQLLNKIAFKFLNRIKELKSRVRRFQLMKADEKQSLDILLNSNTLDNFILNLRLMGKIRGKNRIEYIRVLKT